MNMTYNSQSPNPVDNVYTLESFFSGPKKQKSKHSKEKCNSNGFFYQCHYHYYDTRYCK